MDLREDRVALFGQLADPTTSAKFFDRVAEDVSWTVEGTHPINGTYSTKAEFVRATFDRLTPLMREGLHIELVNLVLDGDTVVVEMRANSTTLEGATYDNHLCWVCRFAGHEPGDLIVEVRAYLDSAMIAWTVMRNER